MAITHIEYSLIRQLVMQDIFPSNPSVLELGQSNWYGDVPFKDFLKDIHQFASNKDQAKELVARAVSLAETQGEHWLFGLADVFWQAFLGPHCYAAIDFDGIDERAHKFDLNEPVPLKETYDVVCNFGTAEHVFNIYQVFKTVHDLTKTSGWMLHGLPFQGWVDHGFYNVQPTLFFDLVAANGYGQGVFLYAEIDPPKIIPVTERATIHELAERGEIGANAMLFAALHKVNDTPFKAPIQAYYGKQLDQESAKRWETLR